MYTGSIMILQNMEQTGNNLNDFNAIIEYLFVGINNNLCFRNLLLILRLLYVSVNVILTMF